ncbi:hypothetical protein AZE42_00805 [Rhizopogon vesiculosus]|uniref:Uncharacterized protein n=1 Tax=Rhizopogon vesiculosus TaxID=180088 RepID=A0A1J8Q1E0_9AGAM|nr:hypothetical protein AZE42_00805 [Rhizopogon vesiculosus]
MLNVFLTVRAIFFTLILYFNLLGTIFAAWNIVSSSSSGMPVPGAAAFLVVNAALIFVLVTMAYSAEAICARARPAHVRFECGWTVLMSILQLSASIYVTTVGPPALCRSQSAWTVCASAALLVPVSWLTTFIMLAYCVTLCVIAATHVYFMPNLWTTPISAVPWFNLTESALYPAAVSPPTRPLSTSSSFTSSESDSSCHVSKFITETWEKLSRVEGRVIDPSKPILFSPGSPSINSTRPAWAKQLQLDTRRGVDQPFSTRGISPSGYSPEVPTPPPKARAKQAPGPKDLKSAQIYELQLARNSSESACSTLTLQTPTIFPKKIADPDLPIPRPRLSEWIPADATTAIDLHTNGHSRPHRADS